MRVAFTVGSLETVADWTGLEQVLGDGHPEVVRNTIRHLKILGAKSYVLEEPYIDRDYSADYLEFYARTFRTHERHCRRAHFFSKDVSPLVSSSLSTQGLAELRTLAADTYCGFCVLRPLPTAPIGRTVLRAGLRRRHHDMDPTVTCRASFDANLLGIDLEVTGAAYLQQDARVGACAQVAIWAGMRHLHARYDYDWVSVADITRLATPTAPDEAVSIPAGSDFLTSERMIRAIAEAGYQPLCFRNPNPDSPSIAAAILPYVESGIPVILGLNLGGEVGHAVTVIGRIFGRQTRPSAPAIDYVPAYIVHDDQGGPYMTLPVKDPDSSPHPFSKDTVQRESTELNMTHATFAVALMSRRVFSTAATAEFSARDRINETLQHMPHIRDLLAQRNLSINERLLDELQEALATGRMVLRTYLSSAAGYRRHLAASNASDDLKDALLDLHLPHFTWITEICTVDSYNHVSAGMRRMYGHTIIDATSTGKGRDAILMLHLPGLVFTNNVDPQPREPQEQLAIIENDNLYNCREKRLD